jgi:hypothetical protein
MLLEILECILIIVGILWFGTLIWFMWQIVKYIRKEYKDDENPLE